MKRLVMTLVLAVGWSAHAVEFKNLSQFPVQHPECKGFVVIHEDVLQYRFYYVSPCKNLELVAHAPRELYPDGI